jgi:hypothetical protein
MLEAFREGGPWKSDGGGRRAEGCLVDSGFGFGFRSGDVGEVGDTLRSRGALPVHTGGVRGAKAMLLQRR